MDIFRWMESSKVQKSESPKVRKTERRKDGKSESLKVSKSGSDGTKRTYFLKDYILQTSGLPDY